MQETNIGLKIVGQQKTQRVMRNKQTPGQKPQYTPVPLLRWLSYSHSLTCCPVLPHKSIRCTLVSFTHLVNSSAPQCHFNRFRSGVLHVRFRHRSEMTQQNSESAYSLFTSWKLLHLMIHACSVGGYSDTQEVFCFNLFRISMARTVYTTQAVSLAGQTKERGPPTQTRTSSAAPPTVFYLRVNCRT